MTVQKLNLPAKENAVQLKINEIIDNLGGGGTVDQVYDGTSANAQSGVAIAGANFLREITSSDVTTALGYTPYNSTNPNGYVTQKVQTLQPCTVIPYASNVSITLAKNTSMYYIVPTGNCSIDYFYDTSIFTGESSASITYTFELCIAMSTAYTIAFPSSIKWQDNETPDMSEAGVYFFAFRKFRDNPYWVGNLQGHWDYLWGS